MDGVHASGPFFNMAQETTVRSQDCGVWPASVTRARAKSAINMDRSGRWSNSSLEELEETRLADQQQPRVNPLDSTDIISKIQTAKHDKWLRAKDRQLCFVSLGGVLLMVVQHVLNHNYSASDGHRAPWLVSLSLAIGLSLAGLTVVSVVLLASYYKTLLVQKQREWAHSIRTAKAKAKSQSSYGFIGSTLLPKFLVEVAIHLLIPFPFIPYGSYAYRLLQLTMFLRVYLLIRMLHTSSDAFMKRARICAYYADFRRMNLQVRWPLTLKLLFYEHSVVMVSVVMLLTLLMSAFCLYVLEGHNGPFGELSNCIWFSFVTFTTIGYGDMVPDTHSGRAVACLNGIMGHSVAAMFGGVVTNKLAPTRTQQLISVYLDNEVADLSYRQAAARLIQSVWRETRAIAKSRNGKAAAVVSAAIMSSAAGKDKTHKRNKVYAAVKRFRSRRYQLAKAQLSASDPVVDQKLDAITNLLYILERQQLSVGKVVAQMQDHLAERTACESSAGDAATSPNFSALADSSVNPSRPGVSIAKAPLKPSILPKSMMKAPTPLDRDLERNDSFLGSGKRFALPHLDSIADIQAQIALRKQTSSTSLSSSWKPGFKLGGSHVLSSPTLIAPSAVSVSPPTAVNGQVKPSFAHGLSLPPSSSSNSAATTKKTAEGKESSKSHSTPTILDDTSDSDYDPPKMQTVVLSPSKYEASALLALCGVVGARRTSKRKKRKKKTDEALDLDNFFDLPGVARNPLDVDREEDDSSCDAVSHQTPQRRKSVPRVSRSALDKDRGPTPDRGPSPSSPLLAPRVPLRPAPPSSPPTSTSTLHHEHITTPPFHYTSL